MTDVFVAYSRQDKGEVARVRQLVEALEGAGFDVFWDKKIPAGENFRQHIDTRLTQSKCVVVVWSEAAAASDWVADEADAAKADGRLVPVKLDDAAVPRGFGQIQWVDFRSWSGEPVGEEWDSLVSAIIYRVFIRDPRKKPPADGVYVARTSSIIERFGSYLPFLRRYARALSGSQKLGDSAVKRALQTLMSGEAWFPPEPGRWALYRLLHAQNIQIGRWPARSAFLLTALEGFAVQEASHILRIGVKELRRLISQRQREIEADPTKRILIIEDEPVIAADIEALLLDLGHEIFGVATTRKEAIQLVTTSFPDLIVSDIQLADGSSGIDAVNDILRLGDVPVIYNTAFPERLLTGEKSEPVFLMTKPFQPETVKAMVGQALATDLGW